MMRTLRIGVVISAVVLAVALSFALAVHNYHECRATGFSRLYCASTHLVR